MEQIKNLITNRRSVRTYDGRALSEQDKESLLAFCETIQNPYGIPVDFKLLDANEHGLTCPVVSGTELFIGGKIGRVPNANEAFGYSFEMLILHAQSLGIGTVWLGGTMNRAAFETAMELCDTEMMPCASPLGYPAKKMSLGESMMRKAIKADERLSFEALFFDSTFDTPLTKEKAGALSYPLEMVRMAPSAVNKQPWRVVITEGAAHFYLKRGKSFTRGGDLDMQKIDMGIALCHFALAAEECGLPITFTKESPQPIAASHMEYIASYQIEI